MEKRKKICKYDDKLYCLMAFDNLCNMPKMTNFINCKFSILIGELYQCPYDESASCNMEDGCKGCENWKPVLKPVIEPIKENECAIIKQIKPKLINRF